jgi:phage terminase large subunit-like protein
MADKSFTRKIEDQLYEFPNWKHDDVIDCLSQWVDYLSNKGDINRPVQRTVTRSMWWLL